LCWTRGICQGIWRARAIILSAKIGRYGGWLWQRKEAVWHVLGSIFWNNYGVPELLARAFLTVLNTARDNITTYHLSREKK
jgi:hypothetical protein